jgi:glycosyltransferase involved in cell wall biosynthesis
MLEQIDHSSRLNSITIKPISLFTKFANQPHKGIGKIYSYLDKYYIFPFIILIKRLIYSLKGKKSIYHIIDHSNSLYLLFLPKKKTIITCHDMLAIKGAFGDKDTYCEASLSGQLLQRLISYMLKNSNHLIFVSKKTKNDFFDFCKPKNAINHKVIYHSNNQILSKLDKTIAKEFLNKNFGIKFNYIIHIGSNLKRKNKEFLFEFAAMNKNIQLIFIGPEFGIEQKNLIRTFNIEDQLKVFKRVSTEELNNFFSAADCLIFPSFSEGFGWPIIEAFQAGCPVLVSHIEPFLEIGEDACTYFNPKEISTLNIAYSKLSDKQYLETKVKNSQRVLNKFEKTKMNESYIEFYSDLI